MKKWFYVLELTGGHYYAGISNNFVRRVEQHIVGKGAEWTKLHPPTRVLFQYEHEVADDRAAYDIEDEITVRLMIEHGWRKVRGGHFCTISEALVESSLRAHGFWDRVLRSSIHPNEAPDDWSDALLKVLRLVRTYHLGGLIQEDRDILLAHLMSLPKHRNWGPHLEAGLEEAYWGRRGVLRVLLSIQGNESVGFKFQDAFSVLGAGMQMGRGGRQPWAHLFLSAWEAYCSTTTSSQHQRIEQWSRQAVSRSPDNRYDEITCILFPELRWRLRRSTS